VVEEVVEGASLAQPAKRVNAAPPARDKRSVFIV
jgi:hypothetical protein